MAQGGTTELDATLSLLPRGAGPRRILLAEDDLAMRSMLVEWLTGAGHTVVECPTAEHLIDHLLRESRQEFVGEDHEPMDLIITDLRMPGRDGLEALESLWPFPLPPIILITAYGDDESRDRASQLDVGAVLFKPFTHSDLLITVAWLTGSQPN